MAFRPSFLIVVAALFFFGGQPIKVKMLYSPDRQVVVRIHTVDSDSVNAESVVEIRKANGKLLAFRNFVSKDHQHGAGVMKGQWTTDSTFFVFSTILSGGAEAGHFPTYFFSRKDNKIRSVDSLMQMRISDPEFFIDPDEIIVVTGIDVKSNGELGDTLSRAAHLNDLSE